MSLAEYTTNAKEDVMHLCTNITRTKPNVQMSHMLYITHDCTQKSIVLMHPLHVRLLSLMDIGLHIQSRNWGFLINQLLWTSLLKKPFLSWDGTTDNTTMVGKLSLNVGPILIENMHSNFLLNKYLIMFEQPQKHEHVCLKTWNNTKCYRTKETQNKLFPTMFVPSTVYDLKSYLTCVTLHFITNIMISI